MRKMCTELLPIDFSSKIRGLLCSRCSRKTFLISETHLNARHYLLTDTGSSRDRSQLDKSYAPFAFNCCRCVTAARPVMLLSTACRSGNDDVVTE